MGAFNDRSRRLARQRRVKEGRESLKAIGAIGGAIVLPFYLIAKFCILVVVWIFKVLFFPFTLLKKIIK